MSTHLFHFGLQPLSLALLIGNGSILNLNLGPYLHKDLLQFDNFLLFLKWHTPDWEGTDLAVRSSSVSLGQSPGDVPKHEYSGHTINTILAWTKVS